MCLTLSQVGLDLSRYWLPRKQISPEKRRCLPNIPVLYTALIELENNSLILFKEILCNDNRMRSTSELRTVIYMIYIF